MIESVLRPAHARAFCVSEVVNWGREFIMLEMENSQKYQFTAVYKKSGKWYLGWVEEISGVNTQGKTLKETKENLQEALDLICPAPSGN